MLSHFPRLTQLLSGRARIASWLSLAPGSLPPGDPACFDVITLGRMCLALALGQHPPCGLRLLNLPEFVSSSVE